MIRPLSGWFGALPRWALTAVGVVVLGVVVGGGYYAFQTYDYIEHDNEFCLSCHLMREPYDRFAQSEHQGLGCKACHKPTFAARSQMALTQIIENPEELAAHAEVSNERCQSCHVEGDPEKWTSIRNSVGHRIHFESVDTTLTGLMCVECHSTSVHEFAPSDRTCGQSGCHTDVRVRLAKMSELTIHCAACHSFNAPVSPEATPEALSAAFRPDAGDCLGCHAMRALVDVPPDEPHQGACGACHNAHEHRTPHEAVETCATAGCHESPTALSPFHRGLGTGVLEDCTRCHQAHDWNAAGGSCVACHEDVFRDAGRPAVRRSAASGGSVPVARTEPPIRLASAGLLQGLLLSRASSDRRAPSGLVLVAAVQARDTLFRHGEHRGVDCRSCHSAEQSHGAVTVTTLNDCRSCHHTSPVAQDCTACHSPRDAPAAATRVRRTVSFSVGRPSARELPFAHGDHRRVQCGQCHTSGLALSADTVSCDGCHQEHHRLPDVRCASCHEEKRGDPHTVQVHLGCSGVGCHSELPFQGVPRERSFCVMCHQDMEEHRTGRPCAACHALPEPRRRGG